MTAFTDYGLAGYVVALVLLGLGLALRRSRVGAVLTVLALALSVLHASWVGPAFLPGPRHPGPQPVPGAGDPAPTGRGRAPELGWSPWTCPDWDRSGSPPSTPRRPCADAPPGAADHRLLRAALADGTGPTIVAGDLNAVPSHWPMRRLRADGFRTSVDLAGAGWQPTWPADRRGLPPVVAIDTCC